MRHHSAGAPALLTPLQRAENLVGDTMNRRGQVLVNQVLVKEARSTVADDDVAIGEWASQSMIRKSMPSGHDPMGGYRFSRGTNAKRLPGDHAQTKS